MKTKRVLVACEYSGIVRDAFLREGHDAISCDLLPTESPGPHVQGDVRPLLKEPWDLVVAHPPCNYLCHYTWVFKNHLREDIDWWGRQKEGAEFFQVCLDANAPRVAVENPFQMNPPSAKLFGKPQDVVQPFEFGEPFRKKTGLWLKNLPPLMRGCQIINPVSHVRDRPSRKLRAEQNKPAYNGISMNAKDRARFWPGIAEAMSKQWGTLP